MKDGIKALLAATLLVVGFGVSAADDKSALNEQALGKELGPIMLGGKAPAPAVMVALFEKYQHLKSGQGVDTLLMGTISSFMEADQAKKGVEFADKILADHSFSVGARQAAGIAKAYAEARAGDMTAAEQALDAAIALDPEHPVAKTKDGVMKQLERELKKSKK